MSFRRKRILGRKHLPGESLADLNRNIERARKLIGKLDPDILSGKINRFLIRVADVVTAEGPDDVKEYIDLVEKKIREFKNYENVIRRGVDAHDAITCGWVDFGGIVHQNIGARPVLLSSKEREKAWRLLAVLRSGIEDLEDILRELKYYYGFLQG